MEWSSAGDKRISGKERVNCLKLTEAAIDFLRITEMI